MERYGARFTAVDINSSFYRPHQRKTYARWSESVPDDFRFAVKVPKTITHIERLKNANELLETFISEATGLGEKLGCLLVQLPPSLRFEAAHTESFFRSLAALTSVPVVCEPRHASWFTLETDAFLLDLQISRVAADPAPVEAAAHPGGWRGLSYYRLHGSPRIYYSAYSKEFISSIGRRIEADRAAGRTVWSVFDNTAEGAAVADALELMKYFEN
ncbi:MAG: hypothetical protein JWL90_297 [Chthoniobacteraceae bacterium]|nr:hypothetical protein [Chthoniobacteraceae bacterium]